MDTPAQDQSGYLPPGLLATAGVASQMRQTPRHATRARQLRLAAQLSAVPWARRLLSQTLRDWGLAELSETALLLASELVSNAVKAAACPAASDGAGQRQLIGLTMRCTGTCLLLEVWDANPAQPVLQEPDPTAESGRGLFLVEALSSRWGLQAADGGKVVWCEIGLPASVLHRLRCPA